MEVAADVANFLSNASQNTIYHHALNLLGDLTLERISEEEVRLRSTEAASEGLTESSRSLAQLFLLDIA